MSSESSENRFKYRRIYDYVHRMVLDGHFGSGDRLPTEAELTQQFGVSRPTVIRALNALQAEGVISRRAGSGSYVNPVAPAQNFNQLFGLLIPGLGKGEIFEPICAQIAARAEANNFSLLWSGSHIRTEEAAQVLVDVARRYVENQVAGVFFEPLELSPSFDAINRRWVTMLEEAGIPIVLIDSDYLPFPQRSRYDLVGIDNFRSGYLATEHYLRRGITRVDFLARPYSAYTISIRLRGYRAALVDYGFIPQDDWVHLGNPEDDRFVRERLVGSGARHVICGNDETAAALMPQLEALGVEIPHDMAIVGFDDIRYASMLKVPLTTLHQPVRDIGNFALEAMLWRLSNPGAPARTITLSGEMIVRESCGIRES
jgi:DNA-binding LacI/PurR family transcriptional regulator